MVARAFVPERALDQDIVGRWPDIRDLSGGRDAEQHAASRREQLLGHQHRERAADHVTDDAAFDIADPPRPHLGVIARPVRATLGPYVRRT